MLGVVTFIIKLIKRASKAFKIAKKVKKGIFVLRVTSIVLGCICLAGIPLLIGILAARSVNKKREGERLKSLYCENY